MSCFLVISQKQFSVIEVLWSVSTSFRLREAESRGVFFFIRYQYMQWNLDMRDCAIIIRRGAEKLEGGALHKIAAKIGGAQSKITHLTEGGP